MPTRPTAAILTVGTEITSGLRLDTNTRELAGAALRAGYDTRETLSLPDDRDLVAAAIRRLIVAHDLVLVTGGLGPTHDDISRLAASDALGVPLLQDERLEALLGPWASRQSSDDARAQVLTQALVLEGAAVIDPTTGTAPGQIYTDASGHRLVLLPGPPHEMRAMLPAALPPRPGVALPRELSVVGMSESDAQLTAQAVLGDRPGITLALLAAPGDVHVVLLDEGAGDEALDRAALEIAAALGDRCVDVRGMTLPEAVVALARESGATIATAESCTGGSVGAAITSVPGSSAVYLGGVVAYSNETKIAVLNVSAGLFAQYGAVSEQTARAMAEEVRALLGADLGVSTTGIAGPDGGSDEKPVGTVWVGIATASGSHAELRVLPGDRAGIRARATVVALDMLRRELRKDERCASS